MLKAKVTVPAQKENVVHRERLIEPMLQNLHRKLIFISAPAGYGKTTLATAFLSELDEDVAKAWYQITDNDIDLHTFFQYIYFSFGQEFPALAERGREIEAQALGRMDPNAAAEELLGALEQHVDKLCVLVLDDFQFVASSEPIISFIGSMLELLPDAVRLVILSRTRTGLPIPKLQIRDEVFQLDKTALAFQKTEVLELGGSDSLNAESVSRLLQKTEGWVAALVLTIGRAESTNQPEEHRLQSLYEFLVDEVLQSTDAHTQRMLTELSVIDEFDAQIASTILEDHQLPIPLSELEKQNQFIARIMSGDVPVFRFHQLFREAIQTRFAEQSPDLHKRKKRIAANLKRAAGDAESSVRYYLAIGDLETAHDVMEEFAAHQHLAGNTQVISEWHEILSTEPSLRDRGANVRFFHASGLYDLGKNDYLHLTEVEKLAKRLEAPHSWRAAVAMSLYYIRSQKDHAKARNVLDQYEDMPGLTEDVKLLYGIRPYAMLSAAEGDRVRVQDLASKFETEVTQRIDKISGISPEEVYYYVSHGLLEISFLYFGLDLIPEAEQLVRRRIAISVEGLGEMAYVQAQMHNNLGYFCMMRGQFVEAWEQFEKCTEAHRLGASKRQRIDILSSKLTLLAAIGAKKEAQEVFEQILQLEDVLWEIGEFRETYDAQLKMASEESDLERLRRLLDDSVERDVWHDDDPLFKLWLGILRFHEEEFVEALNILDSLEHRYRQKKETSTYRMNTLLWLARAHHALGNLEKAHEALKDAMALNGATDYGYAFVVEAAEYRNFIGEIHNYKNLPKYSRLQEQIDHFDKEREAIDIPTVPQDREKSRLDITAFGADEVHIDGQAIGWGKGMLPKAVFFYMLENPGASRGEIGLNFWPDSSKGRADQSVYSTVTRVRQRFMGADVLLYENEGYSINEELLSSYDVRRFEDLLEGDNLEQEEKKVQALREAIEMYQGDFLPGINIEWVELRRDELKEKYLQALEELALVEYDAGNFVEAIKNLDLLLAQDKFREEAQLVLMRCYAAQNKRPKAVKHYEDYKQSLKDELDVDPDTDLQEYVASLR